MLVKTRRTMSLFMVLALLGLAVAMLGCGETTTTSTGAATTDTTAAEVTTTTEMKVYRVGITQIVEHPALDAGVEGFKEAMAEAGFVEGQNVEYDVQSAQGDMAIATTIAQKFATDQVDLICAVATPTSQASVKATSTIPIVFALVTDPVAAGLVVDPMAPEGNVTGVSDHMPSQLHLDLIKELVPEAKTIGFLYNAGESNSVASINEEKPLAEAMGYTVIEATVSSSADVQAAAQSLMGRVDVIALVQDNTVISALEAVIKVAEEAQIPVITSDTDSVARGAAAGLGADGKILGRQAGAMAAQILAGTAIKDIPVQYAETPLLYLNLPAALAQGLTIADDVIARADNVVK